MFYLFIYLLGILHHLFCLYFGFFAYVWKTLEGFFEIPYFNHKFKIYLYMKMLYNTLREISLKNIL